MTMFLPSISGAMPSRLRRPRPRRTKCRPERPRSGRAAGPCRTRSDCRPSPPRRYGAIEDRGNKAGAYALNLVRARSAARQYRRILRLDRDDLSAWAGAASASGDAGDRAARADAGNEDIDLALGVVPDFLRRRQPVNFRIGRILELLRHERRRRRVWPAPAPCRWRPSCPARRESARVRRRAGASILRRSIDIDSGMTRMSR